MSDLLRLQELEQQHINLLAAYEKVSNEKRFLQQAVEGQVQDLSLRKECVKKVVKKHSISIRQACKLFSISRTAYHYVKKTSENGEEVKRLFEIAYRYPTYGYWKIYYLLRDEGFVINHKRVYRLYKKYGLILKDNYNPLRAAKSQGL